MKPRSDVWTEALETWQGMLPPLLNPTVVDPRQAAKITLGNMRAALETWRESCVQAHDLGAKAMDWTASTLEGVTAAVQERE